MDNILTFETFFMVKTLKRNGCVKRVIGLISPRLDDRLEPFQKYNLFFYEKGLK